MKKIRSFIKLNKERVLSFTVVFSIMFTSLNLSGCAEIERALEIYKRREQIENYQPEIKISPENKTAPDIIIVEKIEELDENGDSDVAELSDKDFAKARDELIPNESGPKYYAYDKLNERERVLYTEIFSILSTVAKDTKVSSKDPEQIEKAFNYVMLDHPELFYLTGYSFTKYMRGSNIEKITVSGSYTMNKADIELAKLAIDSYVDKCLSGYDGPVDEYEKVKYVYEYLIKNTEYDLSAPNNQNILSVVKEGRTVCQGYAKTMQYILTKMGVFCILCEGTVKGTESHVWNIVRINNAYYHVDATWGDASYMIEDDSEEFEAPEINYDYLCITDDNVKETHVIKDSIELPVCDSMADNYYVREGLYFTELNIDQIMAAFNKARDRGDKMVTLKCENANVYMALFNHLIDNHGIFDYLNGSTTVNYVEFRDACRISFYI